MRKGWGVRKRERALNRQCVLGCAQRNREMGERHWCRERIGEKARGGIDGARSEREMRERHW